MKSILGLMGDVMIGRLVNETLRTVSPEWVWGDLLPLLRSTQCNFCNLEAALTTRGSPQPKVFTFRSDPSHAEVLNQAHIQGVNLANNHVLDYGLPGLEDTFTTLDQAAIGRVGAGHTLAEACEPLLLKCHPFTLGVIGATDNEPGWAATSDQPGTRYLPIGDASLLSLPQNVDWCAASLHWGPNMVERPPAAHRRFAHDLVQAGFRLIHGHSAHNFQGIEVLNRSLILYDTGDLLDDYAVHPDLRNDLSFLFLVEIDSQGPCRLACIPTAISNCQVNHAQGRDRDWALNRMVALSAELGTRLELASSGWVESPHLLLTIR